MKRLSAKLKQLTGTSLPELILYVFFFAVLIFNHFFYTPVADPGLIKESLNDLEKETIKTLNEMSKLIISIATALFGLIGFFAFESYKATGSMDARYKIDLIAAFGFAALSIDFGYIFMAKWTELLANGTFLPYDTMVVLPQKLQFVSLFIALVFAARMVSRMLFKQEKASA